MTKKTIYLSGPITKVQNSYENFAKVQEQLDAMGLYHVLNPHEFFEGEDTTAYEHNDYMRECIRRMMEADIILTLPGWEASKGARMEVDIARIMQIDVVTSHKFFFKAQQAA